MSRKFEIYDTNGAIRALAENLEYHSEWMDDEYVSVTVRSSEPVQFSVGDKLEYRGETFEINYDPNLIKRARRESHGEAFVYENVRLYSQASRLKDVGFKDYVLNWNSESNVNVYSSQGTFQFFCGSVDDLADRIQANLDRHTPGLWKVFTPNENRTAQRHNAGSLWGDYYDGTESTGKTDVNIEADNLSCKDALGLSYSSFDLSFYVTSATVSGVSKIVIIIGGAPVSAAHNFRYGKGNGLGEIERTSDDTQRIVTKLFAYGSEKNLPMNYYANLGKQIRISILHKSTREIILGQPHLILWVDKEWSKSLDSAFAPNYSVRLTDVSLTATVNVSHDHLNGYDNDHGPLVEDVDYMYFSLWSGDAGAQAFYDAVTAGETFTVTGVSINKMPEEFIYIPTSYNYPALLSINRLMLPGFPDMSLYAWVASNGGTNLNPTTGRATWRGHTAYFSKNARDPWIMSIKSDSLGVREGTLNFDGSAGEDEICPTIEGATDGSGRRLDEVAWAEQMDDNGFLGEDPKEGLLTFGFMPGGDSSFIDWLDNDGDVTISMKDGACVGREFKMKKAEKNANGDWELTLNRYYDESLSRYFPYREYGSNTLFQVIGSGNTHGISSGNHFVILGVSMPQGLVSAASVRLLEKALEQLDKKDHQTYTYIPKIDEIYMQHQDDAVKEGRDAATYGTVSLHDTLHAGMQMEIQDSDLNIHYMPFIDVLTIKEDGNNGIPTYDVVLRDEKELTMQQRIQSQIEGGTEAAINKVEDAYSSSRYLSKIQDDTAQGFIRLIKGLQVGERFVPGLMGEGGVFRKEADGTTYIEADNLYIRMKAYFDTVEIRKFLHTGGNRIATVAGAKCVRVEWRDNANNILVQEQSNLSRAVKFRCFFRANDGDNIVTNDFLVGDQAYCHVTRMQSETMEQASEGTGGSMLTTRHYWRLVIGTNVSDDGGRLTEDGEYWIDLSNYFYNGQPANMTWEAEGVTHNHLSHQAGSDIPMAQDDIVQLGHAYDTTRQGAIVEFVTGGDSPSYQIFQGIDEFSFVGKNYISFGYSTQTGRAYMNVYGDFFFGAKPNGAGESPTYIKYDSENEELRIKAVVEFQSPDDPQTTTTLDDFARLITGDIENIQSQIDGEIDTWFYAGIPTLQNAPANEWLTDTEKEKHTGDLYYDIGTGADAGKAYRFVRSQTTPYVYSWQYIDDTAITEALRIAAHAQDTADHKRRVFLAIPTPPYDEGDLWANAVYPANYDSRTDEEHHKYNNDLLRAKKAVPRTEGGQEITTFSINDWELASKYTDDSALLDFLDGYQGTLTTIRNQVDKKAETWYQDEDPSTLTPQEGGWYGGDDAEHVGDIWFCTQNHASPSIFKKGTTWIWQAHTTEHGVSYAWEEQEIPDEVFDKIDGKSSIYANDPNDVDSTKRHPSNYKANDVWILPMIYVNGVLNPSTYTINNIVYGAGEMLTALRDNETYSAGDWAKKVRYTDDSALDNFKTNRYVQLLTGGQITSDINSARQTADNAQTAAEAAQTSADNANTKLTNWASDSYISPTEKTALKTEWEDVKTEYTQICNDADKYSIDKTAFTSAYTSANAAFQKYTAATPENITVGSDYQNIKDYYAARQTILNAISDAAKTLAQNAATAYMSDTALNAIKYALNGGSTTQDGGLILSNIIALRDANQNVMSGMNGVYNSQLTSGGIAAWYGGAMTDHEQSPSALNYAKSLFRFDGSGYLASGNITWNENGAVTIKNITTLSDSQNTNILNELATFNSAFSFSTSQGSGGAITVLSITPQVPFTTLAIMENGQSQGVATRKWVSDNYISIAFFNRLFQAYSSTTISDANKVAANDTTTAINNLKLLVGTWTNEYLSSLGLNSQQGGDGGDVFWSQLTTGTGGQQISGTLLSAVSNPLYILLNEDSNPSITYNGRANKTLSGILTKSYADARYLLASEGVKSVKYNNGNPITPDSNGVVDLGTIGGGSGTVTSVKVGTTTYNPTNGVVTLPDYLAKTGGTMTGNLYFSYNNETKLTFFADGEGGNIRIVSPSTYKDEDDNQRFWEIDSYNGNLRFYTRSRGQTNIAFLTNGKIASTGQGTLWGSSNDGAGSGLDADLLDGQHGSYYATASALGDYLPKSGGTMTGAITINFGDGATTYSRDYDQITRHNGVLHINTRSQRIYLAKMGTNGLGLDISNITSGSYVQYFQAKDGTIALTSDLSSYVPLSGDVNITGVKYFQGKVKVSSLEILYNSLGFNRNVSNGDIYDTTKAAYQIQCESTSFRLQAYNGTFNRGNVFVYDSNTGNVGIGITSPTSSLDVAGSLGVTGQISSTLATGTAPISVTSTTLCSNLNADLLDGKHIVTKNLAKPYDRVMYIDDVGGMECGRWFDFHYDNTTGSDYSIRLTVTGNHRKMVSLPSAAGTLALTSDNVASATKLQTARTLWGRSFDGTGNVTGSLEYVENIVPASSNAYMIGNDTNEFNSADVREIHARHLDGSRVYQSGGDKTLYLQYYAKANTYINPQGGNVGVATTSPQYTFHVIGSIGVDSAMYFRFSNKKKLVLSANNEGGNVRIFSPDAYVINNEGETDHFWEIDSYNGGLRFYNYNESYQYRGFAFNRECDMSGVRNVSIGGNLTVSGSEISCAGNLRIYQSANNLYLGRSNNSGWVYLADMASQSGTSYWAILNNGRAKFQRIWLYKPDADYSTNNGVYIEYDSNNSGIHIVGGGLYADTYISALGANSSSGGGSGNFVTIDGTQTITGAKTFNAAVQITQKLTVSNSIDVSGVIRSTNSSISCAHDITGGGNLSMNGTATIAGTATIGGYMTIGATVAVGQVSSQVIQTLGSRAIYIKTGSAPNYVDGTWSNTSDIRLKDIINNVGASVDQIANAPIFNYKWKSGGVSIMLGSSAQYWQNVFQHAIEIGPENYLYMDYSSVALASAVMVARKVQNHEDRIAYLERENENLRNRIKQLEAA